MSITDLGEQVRGGPVIISVVEENTTPAPWSLYRESQLRFGKLAVTDTDMVLIDMDPQPV